MPSDYTVTAASVLASSSAIRFEPNSLVGLATGARPNINVAGAAITAGQPIAQDPATSLFYPADANGADPLYKVIGIAENAAAIGQPVSIVTEDPYFTPGCPMLVGDIIVLSATAGRVCPATDIASGWFAAFLMVAYSTTQAKLKIVRVDVAKA